MKGMGIMCLTSYVEMNYELEKIQTKERNQE